MPQRRHGLGIAGHFVQQLPFCATQKIRPSPNKKQAIAGNLNSGFQSILVEDACMKCDQWQLLCCCALVLPLGLYNQSSSVL
jgi:hypothetical protein